MKIAPSPFLKSPAQETGQSVPTEGKAPSSGQEPNLKVRLIDGAEFRDQSLEQQEFSLYATHYDFETIPESEVWIDKNVSEEDQKYFLINASEYVRTRKEGDSEDEAYDEGLSEERVERSFETEGGEGERPYHDEVFDGIYLEKLETLEQDGEQIEVWLVDGQKVREMMKTDFAEGGHGLVYPFIPAKEVWCEQAVSEEERPFVIKHEFTERGLMRQGVDYNDAHDQASKEEFAAREGHKSLEPHKYGCLLANMPASLGKEINDWAIENIPECHLGKGSYEWKPHVTIKYGFTDSGPETIEGIKSLLSRCGPIQIRLGELFLFKGNEDGDVLNIEVDSPKLHELNHIITETFPCYDKYPEYVPHVCIAYLDSSVVESYAKESPSFLNRVVTLDRVEFAGADGSKVEIPLSVFGRKAMSALAEGSGGALVAPAQQGWRCRKPPCRGGLHTSPPSEYERTKALRAKYKRGNFNAAGPPDTDLSDTRKPIEGKIKSQKLVLLVNSPLSSKWQFVGATNRLEFYRSDSGKLFAKDKASGKWYQVVEDNKNKGNKDFSAYTNGQEARQRNESRHSCPYPIGSANCEDWLKGWRGEFYRGKAIRNYRIKSESYFATCKRDEGGQCLPSGQAVVKNEKPGASGNEKEPEPEPKTTPVKQRAERGKLKSAKREGKGKEARITLADGTPAPPHIKPAMVPPAWKNVKISLDPDADVLVTAKDAKGRVKTVYHEKYIANNQAAKFARISEGLKKASAIYEQNQSNRSNPELKENADCVWLMQEQATRPGSDADTKGYAELYGKPMSKENVIVTRNKKGKASVALDFDGKKIPIKDEGTKQELIRRLESGEGLEDSTFWLKSYGATTLEDRHVIEAKDGVRLQFVGKEGVFHNHLVRNKELASMLLERKRRRGKLFNTDYDSVSKYSKSLDGGDFTPKDFRTMKATSLAIEEINKQKDCCSSPDDYKKAVMSVAEKVSNVLGNRPAQALESYISPAVWSQWRNPEAMSA